MRGFQSSLNYKGKGLSETAEMAHILASKYSVVCRDFIASNRSWRKNGVILGAGGLAVAIFSIVLNITVFIILGLVVAAAGGATFAITFWRRPEAGVLAIGKAYWIGSFHDFEGGKLLVDKSQLTEPTAFSVPVPGITPQNMVAAAAKSRKLIENLPILVPRVEPSTGSKPPQGDPFKELKEQISSVTKGLANSREERVSLPVLPNNAPLTGAIIRDIPSAQEVQPGHSLVGVSAEEIETRLSGLGRLTSLVREKGERSASIDELAAQVVTDLEAAVKTLDNTQRVSLIEVLNKSLKQLERAYLAPMCLYYCPDCLEEAARLSHLKLDRLMAIQIDNVESLKELFQGDLVLAEALERFVSTSRAAIMRLDKTDQGKQWRCPQGHQHPLDSERVKNYVAYRAKHELVFPLWDQLWMELSSERAGLHERKDKEQRDNVQAEHRETVQAVEEFNAERRDIRNRIGDLNNSTIRAVETFGELISSFVESGLVSEHEVAGELREAQQFRSEYSRLLAEIDQKIATIEKDLGKKREESLSRHGPVMEFVDTIKIGSQFMPPPPAKGEITVEKIQE